MSFSMPIHKYQAYPTVTLPDRQWPSRTITRAPRWCSVDLRDGNQALPQPMNLAQKLEMFQMLVAMGFREIEVGFPSAAQVEWDFVRQLAEQQLVPEGVVIQVLTPCREPLIRQTMEALRGHRRAIVHLYNSTSEVQRRVVFRQDRAGIRELAVQGARCVQALARELPETEVLYQYSPESFTGTELDFALEVCEAVLEVWQPTRELPVILNLPATVEMSTPNVFADRVEWLARHLSARERVVLSVHPHNDRGTAVAAAELAVMAGADRVEGTLFGNGERTGNVDVLTLALNLFSQGVNPELDLSEVQRLQRVYERCTGLSVPARHPYAGALVYTAFSGSHQDAIHKGFQARACQSDERWEVPYLPIDPADVGRAYEPVIRINSQSGKGGVAFVMSSEFGFHLPKAMHPEFSQVIQKLSEKQGQELPPATLYQAFTQEYLQPGQPLVWQQARLQTEARGLAEAHTRVQAVLEIEGKAREISGEGNGPVDAFVRGLSEVLGRRVRVLDYAEHALERGADSQAVAYLQVEVSLPGASSAAESFTAYGVGVDTAISVASLKALVSAINRAWRRE